MHQHWTIVYVRMKIQPIPLSLDILIRAMSDTHKDPGFPPPSWISHFPSRRPLSCMSTISTAGPTTSHGRALTGNLPRPLSNHRKPNRPPPNPLSPRKKLPKTPLPTKPKPIEPKHHPPPPSKSTPHLPPPLQSTTNKPSLYSCSNHIDSLPRCKIFSSHLTTPSPPHTHSARTSAARWPHNSHASILPRFWTKLDEAELRSPDLQATHS